MRCMTSGTLKENGLLLVADQRELGENGNRRVPGRAGASAGRSGMDEGVRKESDSISAATETGTDVQSL